MGRQEILEHVRLVNAVVGLSGEMEPAEVGSAIARSWNRCVHDFGLDPVRNEPVVILEGRELKDRQTPLARLRAIAQGEMATLYQQLAGSGFSVLLTDTEGVVLDYLGDPTFTDSAVQYGMVEGALWSERNQGTNGMGTCTIEQRPILIHHNEHFLSRNVGLTCSAAPIFNHEGNLLAVLDASSFSHLAQQHTLVLVNMSAKMIENRAFLCNFRNQYVLRFHSRPEFIGTLWEGILALNEEGCILAANRNALFQLGHKKPADLVGLQLRDLFNTGMATLLGGKSHGWLNPVPFYEAHQGNRFFGLVVNPPENHSASVGALQCRHYSRTSTMGPWLLHNIVLFRDLNHSTQVVPTLVGISRKSLFGVLTGRRAPERLVASITAAMLAIMKGAAIVRVHDVAAAVDAVNILQTLDAKHRAQHQP